MRCREQNPARIKAPCRRTNLDLLDALDEDGDESAQRRDAHQRVKERRDDMEWQA